MRIRIITCYDVYNAGASLQAYALMQYLKDCGHEVKIIDYKPDYLSRHYSLKAVNNPEYDRAGIREIYLLVKMPGRIKNLFSKRKYRFDAFRKNALELTDTTYRTCEELKNYRRSRPVSGRERSDMESNLSKWKRSCILSAIYGKGKKGIVCGEFCS